MKKNEYLETLKFKGFELYPPQGKAVYLRCDGVHKYSKRHIVKFIRVNKFNAATFNPNKVLRVLDNKHVEWDFLWFPAEEIDKKYDKDDFD